MSLCVASLMTGRVVPFLHVGQRPPLRRYPQSKRVGGGGGEEKDFGQLQENREYPLPYQMEIYWVAFNKSVSVMFFFYIVSHKCCQ